MSRPFLTAEWCSLLNVTYQVPPELLLPHVPAGVELDVQNGSAFVSFVAFEFLDTRLLGSFSIPFHRRFPEINLRFYVKWKGQRGVCFLREFVPLPAIAWFAKLLYNEPYQWISMDTHTEKVGASLISQHQFTYRNRRFSSLVQAADTPYLPPTDSVEHYFKEHELGFGKLRNGQTAWYRVRHPRWEIYPVERYRLSVDFGYLYGPQWSILNGATPHNVVFAKGSAVEVYNKRLLIEGGPSSE